MTSLREQEEVLFEASRRLSDPVAQQVFLDQACNGNKVLRGRVEELLAAAVEAEGFFSEAAGVVVSAAKDARTETTSAIESSRGGEEAIRFSDEEGAGTRIGRYKLLQRLGEGGCGTVYMAEQETPVRRRVALKIIKLGMDTRNVIARFEAERQALALMDHPNIAKVLDAGATGSGRPYFVMELVRGVRITDFCDQNNLETPQRLDLFIKVCHALQHAHQKGIVHRDMKPSNVLVTLHDGVPVPKVIDFGIAKATSGMPLTDKTLFTAYEQFMGTPAYMSPEQAEMSGLDIDTRSDIYSLGVLLYELLTGRTPFDPKKLLQSGLDEMRRTLREREPQRPSTMLTGLGSAELTETAAHRRAEPPRLITLLRGDLDWIVMKCLEKDRTRRYETVNGLAMDVSRFLSNEPVRARPPSRLYRLQKLMRRNRVACISSAVVAAALVGGLSTSTFLFFKEREARQRAVEAENQQSILRHLAERGREKEAEFRRQAEAREKVTRAAILIGLNRIEEADALVSEIRYTSGPLEGATVLRFLGEWNAIQNRWSEAADRFAMLLRADQFEPWDTATLDYSRCAATLVELGNREEYEAFRRAAIEHFSGTDNPVVAERTVKISLLLPANASIMEQLNPLAAVAASSFAEPGGEAGDDWMPAWRSVSLALMAYRKGEWNEAVEWCRRCLGYEEQNGSRIATARVLLAMAWHQLGMSDEARLELGRGRELIEARFAAGLETGTGSGGFWFDWIIARTLLREAISQMHNDQFSQGSGPVTVGPAVRSEAK